MKDRDDQFHRVLRAQAGAISIDQVRALGFRLSQIDHRRNSGQWVTLHRRVVSLPGVPPTWDRDLVAAVLFLRGRAVPSHTTAARLLGILPLVEAPGLEFTEVEPRRNVGGRLTVHHARRLDDVDVVWYWRAVPPEVKTDRRLRKIVLRKFRVTSATRTIIDLAGRVDANTLGNCIDGAVSRKLTTADFLARRAKELGGRGHRGTRALAEVLLDSGGESWLERRFLKLIRGAGMASPRCQVCFREDGVTVARVDFHFDGTAVIVEVSGRRGHASERDRRTDARRRNALQRAGYEVVEFVTSDVIGDPTYVVATLRAALSGQPRPLRVEAAPN